MKLLNRIGRAFSIGILIQVTAGICAAKPDADTKIRIEGRTIRFGKSANSVEIGLGVTEEKIPVDALGDNSTRKRGARNHLKHMSAGLKRRGKRSAIIVAHRKAVISSRQNHVCVVENVTLVGAVSATGVDERYSEPGVGAAEIVCYSNEGQQIWEKQFPEGRQISIGASSESPKLSADGDRLAIITAEEFASSSTVHMYGPDGVEIFRFPPLERMKEFTSVSRVVTSENGKFLALEARYYQGGVQGVRTEFVNVNSKSILELRRYLVKSISDEGIASVRNPWDRSDSTKTIQIPR